MQIKNKVIVCVVLIFFTLNLNLAAEEFNISASEIIIDKNKDIVVGKGSVEVTDKEGKLIKADKVTYEKSKEFITAEGSVEVLDTLGNILKSDKAKGFDTYGTQYQAPYQASKSRKFNTTLIPVSVFCYSFF